MIKIIIADDHALFRQGFIKLLQGSDQIEIVAEAANGSEAWQSIQQLSPDIAVLDISMPEPDGLEIARCVNDQELPTKVVLLTMHDEPELAAKAKQLGVAGYILKEDTFEELLNAINKIINGKVFISPTILKKLKHYVQVPEISNREKTVLSLIAKGMTNKQIASELKISPKTVDTYRTRLMVKLDLHSIAELTQYAVKTGLLS